ncbi:MAG: hypothetical protein HRU26_05055 [Psychroserpens sp.]|nr:hypothetical protein [Psychroserpens sp.]
MISGIFNYPDSIKGDTIASQSIRFSTKDSNGDKTPIDLTNKTIRCHFTYQNKKVKLEEGSGITIIDAADGRFRIDSFTLPCAGVWVYDVEMSDDNTNEVYTYLRGSIKIINDVTL